MAITWLGTAWAALTAYAIGARVVNSGNVYRCITAGTSAGATGPTGTAADITDGTVHWKYLGANGPAVVDLAPELSTGTAAGTQNQILIAVDLQVPTDGDWGDLRDQGACYLAAHLATLAKSRGRGPLASQTVGPLSRSYGGLLQFGELGLTSYGVEYQRLMRLLASVLGATT